ncbi:MAG: Ig-like domain-containing protein [Patescibacteria group bacterium]
MISRLWDKRIPTLLGIGLIAGSVILTSIFIKNQTIFRGSAITIEDPQNITITNVTDTSLVLSYETRTNVASTVSFGKDTNMRFTEIEDIDSEKGAVSPHAIHITTLKNLTANTKYYFVINSGQTTFLKNNVPFEAVTGPSIPTPPLGQLPITGKVILPDGSIPKETVAYLTILGAQTLSTSVRKDGSFTFILGSLRSEDLSSYSNLDKNSNLKITFVSDPFSSRVLASYGQTNPLPTITLSNNYDFTTENSVPITSPAGGIGGFQEILPSPSLSKNTASITPVILVPKKDQSFKDSKPQFRGTSLPNEKVKITINSSHAITAQITADSKGDWVFNPQTNLTPGPHTITVQTKDAFGIVKTITQSFVVYAAENLTPTPSPTITPTAAPTPTPTPDLTLLKQIPPTGDPNILFIGIAAIFITAVGAVLFLLTRSKASL